MLIDQAKLSTTNSFSRFFTTNKCGQEDKPNYLRSRPRHRAPAS